MKSDNRLLGRDHPEGSDDARYGGCFHHREPGNPVRPPAISLSPKGGASRPKHPYRPLVMSHDITIAVTGILCQSVMGAVHPANPMTGGSRPVVAERSHTNPANGKIDVIGFRRVCLFDGEVCHDDSFCTTKYRQPQTKVKAQEPPQNFDRLPSTLGGLVGRFAEGA